MKKNWQFGLIFVVLQIIPIKLHAMPSIVDLSDGKVFQNAKIEIQIPVYYGPSEKSGKLGTLNFSSKKSSYAKVNFKSGHKDTTERSFGPDLHNNYCGGKLVALQTALEDKNGFYKIKLGYMSYAWVKVTAYPLENLNNNSPLKVYSKEGKPISIQKITEEEIEYSTEGGVISKKPLSALFSKDGALALKFLCDNEHELKITNSRLGKLEPDFSKEPLLINFQDIFKESDPMVSTKTEKIIVYSKASVTSEVLGELRVNDSSIKFHSSLLKNEANITPNLYSGYCRVDSQSYSLHHVKDSKDGFVDLGEGPWGKEAWIKFHVYGLFSNSPFEFQWLSEYNWVRFRRDEKGFIFARGHNAIAPENGGVENQQINLPVRYTDLFDEKGTLQLELNCNFGC